MTICAAAMMPSDKVWSAFNRKLSELVAEDRMTADRATTYLFNGSVNAILSEIPDAAIEDGFTDAQMEEVIERGNLEIAESVNGAELRESKNDLKEVTQRLSSLEQADLDKDRQIAELTKRLGDATRKSEKDREALEKSIRDESARDARFIGTVLIIICVLGIGSLLFACFMMGMIDVAFSIICSVILGLAAFLVQYLRLTDKLAERIAEKRLRAIFPEGK